MDVGQSCSPASSGSQYAFADIDFIQIIDREIAGFPNRQFSCAEL